MNRLLSDVDLGLYKAALVVDIDRLSRGIIKDSEIIKKHLIDSDTILYGSITSYDFSNYKNNGNPDFKSIFSRMENDAIRYRLREGEIGGAKQGYWTN